MATNEEIVDLARQVKEGVQGMSIRMGRLERRLERVEGGGTYGFTPDEDEESGGLRPVAGLGAGLSRGDSVAAWVIPAQVAIREPLG
jgi:hypothetical protein